jgi:hypothetical protein
MDEGTGQIRQDVSDIIRTRAAMAEKLQLLEDRIQDTVEGAKAAVLDVVENVKDTAEDLLDRTKRTFDPFYQTEQHPLVMIGAAAALGYWLGRLTAGDHIADKGDLRMGEYPGTPDEARRGRSRLAPITSQLQQAQQAIVEGFMDQVHDEVSRVKGALAIAARTFLRGVAKQALDMLAETLEASAGPVRRPYSNGRR